MAWLALHFSSPAPARTAALAVWAQQFTPQVSLAADDTLLLDLAGCPHLFGGIDALLARAQQELAGRELPCRSGLGHTPWAAHRLAWHGVDARTAFDADGAADPSALRPLLAALPIPGPGIDDDHAHALQRMGFSTLGDLLALPRAALDRRFGRTTGHWLAQLAGEQPDPRRAVAPPVAFCVERDFLDVVTHTAYLVRPLQTLLTEFTQFLRLRQLATQRIDWQFRHSDRTHSTLPVVTTRPETDGSRLLALTRVKLETFRVGTPIEGVQLSCRQLLPLAALPATLFPELAARHQRDVAVLDLLDRLRTRLGNAACRQWMPRDSHRPEATAVAHVPGMPYHGGDTAAPAGACVPGAAADDAGAGTVRPLWLLPAPQPIRTVRTPARTATPYWHGVLVLQGSPERLSAEWWSTAPFARDYHVARRDDGVLLWLFRDLADGRWYVHGVFG